MYLVSRCLKMYVAILTHCSMFFLKMYHIFFTMCTLMKPKHLIINEPIITAWICSLSELLTQCNINTTCPTDMDPQWDFPWYCDHPLCIMSLPNRPSIKYEKLIMRCYWQRDLKRKYSIQVIWKKSLIFNKFILLLTFL